MYKNVIIIFFGLLILQNGYSQSIFIQQSGNIVFGAIRGSGSLAEKEKAARVCNEYIYRFYRNKRLPFVYLSLVPVDSVNAHYSLSYDNFYGNSLENGDARRKGKYYAPGIRIISVLGDEIS